MLVFVSAVLHSSQADFRHASPGDGCENGEASRAGRARQATGLLFICLRQAGAGPAFSECLDTIVEAQHASLGERAEGELRRRAKVGANWWCRAAAHLMRPGQRKITCYWSSKWDLQDRKQNHTSIATPLSMQLCARARDVHAFLLLPPRAAQMTCVICLTAANTELVCSCAALACRGCLLALLDHGKERCVVCGSRLHPSAVVDACLSRLEGPASDGSDPAKAYVKLAIAYSTAGDPRCALRSLAIAQHLVVPGSRWDQVIALETAQNLLAIS